MNFIRLTRNISIEKTIGCGIFAVISLPFSFAHEYRRTIGSAKYANKALHKYAEQEGKRRVVFDAGIMAIFLSWNWIACFIYASIPIITLCVAYNKQ